MAKLPVSSRIVAVPVTVMLASQLLAPVSMAYDVLQYAIPSQTNHGLRVTVVTTKYFRRGNHIAYRTARNVCGITRY